MKTTTVNTVSVRSFETPEAVITMSEISVDTTKKTFSMNLRIGDNPIQKVVGTVTQDLANWLSLGKPEKVKVVADNEQGFEWVMTGRIVTTFQRFMERLGYQEHSYDPGAISQMIFKCDNRSDSYADNPFRLFMGNERNILTMVNIPSKKTVRIIDHETGETTVHYKNKIGTLADGTKVKAFINKTQYRRLVIETITERERYHEPENN